MTLLVLLLTSCGTQPAGAPPPEPPPTVLVAPAPAAEDRIEVPVFSKDDWQYVGRPDSPFPTWEDAYQAEGLGRGYAVVLHEAPSEERVWLWFETYLKHGAPTRAVDGYPFVASTSDLQGMEPGHWVVIAAVPADRERAEQIRDWFQTVAVGGLDLRRTTLREVLFPAPEERVFVEYLQAVY